MKFLEGLSNSFWSDHTAITNLQGGGGSLTGPPAVWGPPLCLGPGQQPGRTGLEQAPPGGLGWEERGWLCEYSMLVSEIVCLLNHKLPSASDMNIA